MEINELVIFIRKKLGFSQVEFSKIVGCSQSAIAYWETGKKKPSYKFYKKLLDIRKGIKKNP